ncbi:PadR family transcriptional regulator [Actinomadura madurae]|uniref:PadR family transcriptional regulator n=1 Tax=Actinomadura madurae TaxID=1993 RepID=UPI0020D22C61|nr:PadR family transcriptional regulator [Actinomadura madurae]MCQ0015408.1 PadR family transcriptional regulator [Actinomadura madurae]
MVKRRKVSNLLGLAVLSTLMTRPMYPYEVASSLRARGKDDDMAIKWGSLYRVVQNLEKYGFVEAVHSERQGARPERTVYRITEAGRAELVDWVRELVGETQREESRFKAGLSVLSVLSPDEAVELLRTRARRAGGADRRGRGGAGRAGRADSPALPHRDRVRAGRAHGRTAVGARSGGRDRRGLVPGPGDLAGVPPHR